MKIGNKILFTMALLSSFTTEVFAGGYGCGTGASQGCGGGSALKLLALVLILTIGYWVLTMAAKQKKPLDKIGNYIGGLIILVSLAGMLCMAVYGYCKWKGKCSSGGEKSSCTYKLPPEASPK